jgi:hypothetical protein
MLRGRPHDELMTQFIAAHQNTWNRRLHFVGIPTLVVSGLLWVAAIAVDGLWVWPAILMPLGFGCQFLGHAIEGNRPEVFSDWRFFFIGLEWWCDLARCRV